MSRFDQASLHDAIEDLIDIAGISGVLRNVVNICHEKEAHVQEAWQDEALAREWQRRAKTVDSFLHRYEKKHGRAQ